MSRLDLNLVRAFVAIYETRTVTPAAGRLNAPVADLPAWSTSRARALLFTERYVSLIAAKHPSIGDAMTLDEFIGGRHVMVASPFSGHRLIDEALRNKGVSRKIVARV